MKIAIFNEHINSAVKETGTPRIELLKQLRQKGIVGLEYGLQELTDIEATTKELAAVDMKICSIYQHCHYEDNPQVDTKIIDIAMLLGVEKVLIIPGFFQENQLESEVLNNCRNALNDLIKYAKSKDIKIMIEDFDAINSVTLDSQKMKWFSENVIDLYYTFDTGNFIYSGENELVVFDKLKDNVIHVHLKDRIDQEIPQTEHVITIKGERLYSIAPGYGIVKNAEIIDKLKEMNYQGFITIEHFGVGNYWQSILDSLDWLNNHLS